MGKNRTPTLFPLTQPHLPPLPFYVYSKSQQIWDSTWFLARHPSTEERSMAVLSRGRPQAPQGLQKAAAMSTGLSHHRDVKPQKWQEHDSWPCPAAGCPSQDHRDFTVNLGNVSNQVVAWCIVRGGKKRKSKYAYCELPYRK